jgi:ribosome maturation factor RimP
LFEIGARPVGKAKRSDRDPKRHPKPPVITPAVEQQIMAQAWPLAEALCDSEGLELVHLEYRRERGGRIMRLYIDKPGGVSIDDCAAVSSELGDVLDVNLPDIGPYHLEISSPGPNRPLARETDYERFRGQRIKIRTLESIQGQKNFSGVLEGLADGTVRINVGETTVAIPIDRISKGYLMDSKTP